MSKLVKIIEYPQNYKHESCIACNRHRVGYPYVLENGMKLSICEKCGWIYELGRYCYASSEFGCDYIDDKLNQYIEIEGKLEVAGNDR